jgi:hypothetical protein
MQTRARGYVREGLSKPENAGAEVYRQASREPKVYLNSR